MEFGDKIYFQSSTGWMTARIYRVGNDFVHIVWWKNLICAKSKRVIINDIKLIKKESRLEKMMLSIRMRLLLIILFVLMCIFLINTDQAGNLKFILYFYFYNYFIYSLIKII